MGIFSFSMYNDISKLCPMLSTCQCKSSGFPRISEFNVFWSDSKVLELHRHGTPLRSVPFNKYLEGNINFISVPLSVMYLPCAKYGIAAILHRWPLWQPVRMWSSPSDTTLANSRTNWICRVSLPSGPESLVVSY